MKVIVAIAAALLCASAAPAGEGPHSSSIPPERYQAVGAVPVVFVPYAALYEVCGMEKEDGKTLLACTRTHKEGFKIIFMPDPCPVAEVDFYARIQCHENAHALGGWSGNHEI